VLHAAVPGGNYNPAATVGICLPENIAFMADWSRHLLYLRRHCFLIPIWPCVALI